MKTSIFLTFALILILAGLFFSHYPLSESQVLTPYRVENVITSYSTSQTLTFSTSITSYAMTVKDEERFMEDDFETHIWARAGLTTATIVVDNILTLTLKGGDKVTVDLDSPYEGRLVFSRRGAIIREAVVYRGANSYGFDVDKPGNYTILYRVEGPRQAFKFKAAVTVSRLSTQWTAETWTSTSTVKRVETISSTETLTRYSTVLVAAPLEKGRMVAYVLYGLAAATAAATLAYMARRRFAPGFKFCPKCGAKLKPEAKFCDECGSKVE